MELARFASAARKAQFRAQRARCARRTGVVATSQQPDGPRKVAIFVEPSPFSHISGMKNRFEQLIKNLRTSDVNVTVFTPDRNPPAEYHGAKVVNVLGFRLPFYSSPTLLLSLGLSVRVLWYLMHQRPNIIHVSSPGLMVFAAVLYARMLAVPLVVSYHTHIPEYIPKYTWKGLVEPMWYIIRWYTRQSDLTLVTSKAMKEELSKHNCRERSIDIWQKGVDTDTFSPSFRSQEMRHKMTDGNPDSTVLIYVGRLGAEKNLKVMKDMLSQIPNSRLVFVGDGPERADLEQHYAGMPVKFMGMLKGEALSQAYASADIFIMPSETETLGFVVLEAMAAGLPVVAVAAGGIPDIITKPATTGFMYPPGDYQTAARITAELAKDSEMRAKVGQCARDEVLRWGWRAATQTLHEQQYARAVRLHSSKRRFRLPALRVTWERALRALGSSVFGFLATLAFLLDYARDHRQPAGVQANI